MSNAEKIRQEFRKWPSGGGSGKAEGQIFGGGMRLAEEEESGKREFRVVFFRSFGQKKTQKTERPLCPLGEGDL